MNWVAFTLIMGGCFMIHPGLFILALGVACLDWDKGFNLKITRTIEK